MRTGMSRNHIAKTVLRSGSLASSVIALGASRNYFYGRRNAAKERLRGREKCLVYKLFLHVEHEKKEKKRKKEKERVRDLAVHENPVTPVFPCRSTLAPESLEPLLSASCFMMTVALQGDGNEISTRCFVIERIIYAFIANKFLQVENTKLTTKELQLSNCRWIKTCRDLLILYPNFSLEVAE
ncbi:hypothetical protein PUN28_009078 [Cardiocondyla obscurior]|uniref:Uncharacterized protein n=1 Tax=Cardiocondyla obscurior TaxID=286306 RepID=A0AAW2FQD4_9HYME